MLIAFKAAALVPHLLALGPPPAAVAGQDIVEDIDLDAAQPLPSADSDAAAAAPAAPATTTPVPAGRTPVPVEQERFDVGGFARLASEYWPGASPPEVGRSDSLSRLQLLLEARYARGRHFEVALGGQLNQLWAHEPQGFRGSFEPLLREAFVGLYSSAVDLRIGQQRLAWGNTEFLSPNDVLNARDFRDPFVGPTELRSLPTPMVRLDTELGPWTGQLVLAPVFVPDRYDVYGTNWSVVQPSAGPAINQLAAGTVGAFDPSLYDPAQRLFQQTQLPRADFAKPSFGSRLGWSGEGVDLHLYYHYGYGGPKVALGAAPGSLDVRYVRRHHLGLDWAALLGPFAWRLDAAYQTRSEFLRDDFLSHQSRVVQVAGAIEYQTGEVTKVLLLEGYYQHLLDPPPGELLFWRTTSVGFGLLAKWPLFASLHAELRTMLGVRPLTGLARAELAWKQDSWQVACGGLLVEGEEPSFGWYYRDNDEVYAALRREF